MNKHADDDGGFSLIAMKAITPESRGRVVCISSHVANNFPR
jgi:hypothetical protein